MKKWILGLLIIIVVVACITGWFFMNKGPDLSQYESLKNPAMTELPTQNMLVVVTSGDPNQVAGSAIKLLYRTFYSLKGVSRKTMVAPRARWMTDYDAPKERWMGQFALPIPDSVNTVPPVQNRAGLRLYITTWNYGTCAEILHIGSYATESGTIKRLKDYITAQGYQIIGAHEEEYLKGPGMFGPGKPEEYRTIIRYQVEKVKITDKQ